MNAAKTAKIYCQYPLFIIKKIINHQHNIRMKKTATLLFAFGVTLLLSANIAYAQGSVPPEVTSIAKMKL
jgi:hypothetical protein